MVRVFLAIQLTGLDTCYTHKIISVQLDLSYFHLYYSKHGLICQYFYNLSDEA